MECNHKTNLSKEDSEAVNKAVLDILKEGLNIVRNRFPTIQDVIDDQNELSRPEEQPKNPSSNNSSSE